MSKKSRVQKIIAVLMAIALIAVQAPATSYAQDKTVSWPISDWFPGKDGLLAQFVANSFWPEKDIDDIVSLAELEGVTYLNIYRQNNNTQRTVDFSGIENLPSVTSLSIYDLDASCKLSDITSKLSILESFYIEDSTFTEANLSDVRNLNKLKALGITVSNLTGDIAVLPSSLTSLTINSNGITGNIADLPSGLTSLTINSNGITGDIADLPSDLTSLTINSNRITGDIADLPSGLESLVINSINITGNVSELKSRNRLSSLSLENTTVSVDFSDLKNFNQLSDISITGKDTTISGSLSDILDKFRDINLSGTDLSVDLADLKIPKELQMLNLSNNENVTGNLENFCASDKLDCKLSSLNLSNTNIEGELADLNDKFTYYNEWDEEYKNSLYELFLANTKVTENMSESYALLQNLQCFDFSNTHLYGDVSWIGDTAGSDLPENIQNSLADLSYIYDENSKITFSNGNPVTITVDKYLDKDKKSVKPEKYYISTTASGLGAELTGDNLPIYTPPSDENNYGSIEWPNPVDWKDGYLSYTFDSPITIEGNSEYGQPDIIIPYSGTVTIPFTNTLSDPKVEILTKPEDIISSCKVNEPYSQIIEVKRSNSDKPVYMKLSEGSLPDGLNLKSGDGSIPPQGDILGTIDPLTGNFKFIITGTPKTKGDYSFVLYAFIDGNVYDTEHYTINVTKNESGGDTDTPYVEILTTSIPSVFNADGTYGPQTIEVERKNSSSNVYVKVSDGSQLPDGLVITGSAISGSAIVCTVSDTLNYFTFKLMSSEKLPSGTHGFNLEAFLDDGTNDIAHYTITVPNPSIKIETEALPGGKVNMTYAQSIEVTVANSDLPAYMTVSSGQLPPGLSLKDSTSNSALGVLNPETDKFEFEITGTPTQSGTYNFTLRSFLDEITYDEREFSITITRSGGGGSSSNPSNTTQTTPSEPALNLKDHVQYMDLYSDGSFMPNRPITRGEVAAAFARLLVPPIDASKTYECSFTDVSSDYIYKDHIGFLEQYSILKGYPDGTFRPDDYITRAEFAAVAARFDKLEDVEDTIFTDIDENNMWALPSINSAYKKGWVDGYEGNLFKPNQNLTRAEFTTIISRILNRIIDENSINGKTYTKPADASTEHWAYYYIIESLTDHDYTRDDDNHEVWE